jgi:hypothetical protein
MFASNLGGQQSECWAVTGISIAPCLLVVDGAVSKLRMEVTAAVAINTPITIVITDILNPNTVLYPIGLVARIEATCHIADSYQLCSLWKGEASFTLQSPPPSSKRLQLTLGAPLTLATTTQTFTASSPIAIGSFVELGYSQYQNLNGVSSS